MVCNIEEGGLLMIIGIVLIEIGSCMDDVIYEEFKGIGNMEVYFECCFVEKCVYLLINLNKLGMCCEEMLIKFEIF